MVISSKSKYFRVGEKNLHISVGSSFILSLKKTKRAKMSGYRETYEQTNDFANKLSDHIVSAYTGNNPHTVDDAIEILFMNGP